MHADARVVRPGDVIRVRLLGRSRQHEAQGTVVTAHHSRLNLCLTQSNRTVELPSDAISELAIWQGTEFVAGTLPKSLDSLIAPLADCYTDASGKPRRNISDSSWAQLLSAAETAQSGLYDEDLSAAIAHVISVIRRLKSLRDERDYKSFSTASLEMREELRNARDRLPSTYMHDLGQFERIISGSELLVDRAWQSFTATLDPKPRFTTDDRPIHVVAKSNGEVALPLRIFLESHTAPARNIQVVISPKSDVVPLSDAPSIDQIQPGATYATEVLAVVDAASEKSARTSTIQIKAQLNYLTPSGEIRRSQLQTIRYQVAPKASFCAIQNPYKPYAGGTTVADPSMFFGREFLLDELLKELRDGPAGQGLALYGQKRSGKTSLVEQLRARADRRPLIVLSISLGILDRSALTESFAQAVLDQARVALLPLLDGQAYRQIERMWPSDEKIEQRPLGSLISALTAGRAALSKQEGWSRLRYLLLVDEFTYLYEVIKSTPERDTTMHSDVREFLRQWKALLETRAFTSVVVGQDTMPYFMSMFPNEFSSMRPIRLGYLNESETRELAERPIQLEGRSRYTGYATDVLFQYTNGHPYFTQMVCDRLVDLANDEKRDQFSEYDVEKAVRSLVAGDRRVDPYRFDCLLTADNSGLIGSSDGEMDAISDPDADFVYEFLARIAAYGGSGDRPVMESEVVDDDLDTRILRDLITREVISAESGRLRIRVPLFAEYLRNVTA